MNQVDVNSKKKPTLTPQHQRCCKICLQRNNSAISRAAPPSTAPSRSPSKRRSNFLAVDRRRRTLHDLSVHKHLTVVAITSAPKEIRIPHFGKRSRVTQQVTRHFGCRAANRTTTPPRMKVKFRPTSTAATTFSRASDSRRRDPFTQSTVSDRGHSAQVQTREAPKRDGKEPERDSGSRVKEKKVGEPRAPGGTGQRTLHLVWNYFLTLSVELSQSTAASFLLTKCVYHFRTPRLLVNDGKKNERVFDSFL